MSRELTYLYMGKPAKYWAELEAEKKDLDAALVQSVINDAQRLRQLKELGQRLTEAIQLLHKDADWFDLNKQEQRAAELRDRLTALQEAGVK